MSGVTAVVNPAAGGGRGAAVAAALAAHLPDLEVAASTDHAHAAALSAQACARGRVVLAVGGDGHAACVAGPVVEAGGVLGLLPAGRGNDFARALGLPTTPAGVAGLVRAGATRAVDVLDVGGRVVLGSVYAGVDSVAGEIANARPRWVPGPLVYRYAAVRALLTFRPVGFTLRLDGGTRVERGYCAVLANSGFYGAGMHIVPTAVVDDGQIDVLVIREGSRWDLVASLRQVYAGTHLDRPDVVVHRARTVELSVDPPVPVHADGEPLALPPVTVTVRAGALRVLSPP